MHPECPRDAEGDVMAVKRMDNMGIAVVNLDAAVAFVAELGLTLEGRMGVTVRSCLLPLKVSTSDRWQEARPDPGAPGALSSCASGRRMAPNIPLLL